jgi:hypothetical protein
MYIRGFLRFQVNFELEEASAACGFADRESSASECSSMRNDVNGSAKPQAAECIGEL